MASGGRIMAQNEIDELLSVFDLNDEKEVTAILAPIVRKYRDTSLINIIAQGKLEKVFRRRDYKKSKIYLIAKIGGYYYSKKLPYEDGVHYNHFDIRELKSGASIVTFVSKYGTIQKDRPNVYTKDMVKYVSVEEAMFGEVRKEDRK